MASLQSASAATPSPSAGKGYDQEILDIAGYVHNQKIDSELAVSGELLFFFSAV
jgi:2-methylcitrate dehydratase